MHLQKFGTKALGLSVLAICMMAFGMASVAHAEETGGTWTWSHAGNTGTFSSTLEASPVIALENNTASILFITGGGTSVAILCTAAEFDEGGQLAGNGEILLGRIRFTGCVTRLNGSLSAPCKPFSPGTSPGTILTEKGKGLMLLHKLSNGTKDPTILLEPDTGTELVKFELSEECSIGEEVPVTGHLVIWDCQGAASFVELKVTHLLEEFPALRELVALGQPATLSGSANVTLGGAHLGYAWGGTPN